MATRFPMVTNGPKTLQTLWQANVTVEKEKQTLIATGSTIATKIPPTADVPS
jgi:hypothetical protein